MDWGASNWVMEGGRGPVPAPRRLDHVGDDVLVRLLVEVAEALAAGLSVLRQVEVRPVGDALQLRPAHREEVLDIVGALRPLARARARAEPVLVPVVVRA